MNTLNRLAVSLFLFIGVILGCIVLAFILWQQSTPQVKPNTVLLQSIQALSRFETAQYTLETIIDKGGTDSPFKQFLFGDRILLIAHGTVIAGFDLSTLTENDIVVSGKNIALTLPAPQILSVSLDPSKTRVYDRKLGLLTKGSNTLESEARQQAQDSIVTAACSQGLMDKAVQTARTQLSLLLSHLGFTGQITITIPSGSCAF